MKEVWFYTYFDSEFCFSKDNILYSHYYDTFEEAWESRENCVFAASPVMKGYIKVATESTKRRKRK